VKVVKVQHVSVNCHGRLDATRRFYSELFEAPDLSRPEIPGIDGSWLGLGDVQLHLVDAVESGESPDPVAPHWCLWVDDIDEARAELGTKGIDYVEGTQGGRGADMDQRPERSGRRVATIALRVRRL
jgi:catechol 2,3-dioxygenase-like lactoylglutathione lyase family enzyme